MKWIEISVAIERVVIEEVTTLFDTYSSNGFIEEDIPNEPAWVQLTLYGDAEKTPKEWEELIAGATKNGSIHLQAPVCQRSNRYGLV